MLDVRHFSIPRHPVSQIGHQASDSWSTEMANAILPLPEEPVALRTIVRTLLEQAPEVALPLVVGGEWIADPLWEQ
jgi:hypothetical protein